MLFKILIILFLFFIIYSLASGLFYLMKDKGQTYRVVKALSWRIALSFVVFIMLITAYYLGWIQPHPI